MATSIIKADEIRKVNDTVLMSDGALSSNVQFPTGHVIQTVSHNAIANAHEAVGNSSTYTSSFLQDTITTKLQNSKIRINFYTSRAHSQQGTMGSVWLQKTIGGTTTQIHQDKIIYYWGNMSWHEGSSLYQELHIDLVDSPNVAAGTAITYAARYRRPLGSNSFYFVHSDAYYQRVLQEIAP